ncbi:MAG: SDR family oxidoreductase [Acidimicrobiia bacterium]
MILVVGGSGRLGRIVVDRLVSRGDQVRVLTRSAIRPAHLGPTVDVVTGDARLPATLESAMIGVDLVVSAMHGFVGRRGTSPASVDRDGNENLVDAAKAAGAHIVILSLVGASLSHPLPLARMKYVAEQYAWRSGVETTVVRATAFMELWLDVLRQTVGRSNRPLVFGRGDNPINFVSVQDVAALVDLTIHDLSTRGSTFEIGGPANISFNEFASKLRPGNNAVRAPRHVPRAMLALTSVLLQPLNTQAGRQARSALVMDSADLTFDATEIHRSYPQLPFTSLDQVLDRDLASK